MANPTFLLKIARKKEMGEDLTPREVAMWKDATASERKAATDKAGSQSITKVNALPNKAEITESLRSNGITTPQQRARDSAATSATTSTNKSSSSASSGGKKPPLPKPRPKRSDKVPALDDYGHVNPVTANSVPDKKYTSPKPKKEKEKPHFAGPSSNRSSKTAANDRVRKGPKPMWDITHGR